MVCDFVIIFDQIANSYGVLVIGMHTQ